MGEEPTMPKKGDDEYVKTSLKLPKALWREARIRAVSPSAVSWESQVRAL